MDSVSIETVLIAIGILANGFFAASEFALVTSRISRLAELRAQAVRGAAAAMRLKEKPEAFLATIRNRRRSGDRGAGRNSSARGVCCPERPSVDCPGGRRAASDETASAARGPASDGMTSGC